MKRFVVLMLALVMILSLAACGGKTKCDICGETKSCKSIEVLGEKINICDDCQSQMEDLANSLGDLDLSALG